MTRIRKLGHVVLYVCDPMASADWYCDILGMEAVIRDQRIPGAFLSLGRRDHDIALFKAPDDRRLGQHDFDHVSFEIDGGLEDLKAFHDKLKQRGVRVTGVVDHGISYGVYFLDPDGHQLEVFYQRVEPDSEAKRLFSEIGAMAKHVDLSSVGS